MKITFLTPPPLDGKRIADRVAGCAYGLYPVPNIFELTVAAVMQNDNHDVAYVNYPSEPDGKSPLDYYIKNDDSDVYCMYTVNLTRDTDRTCADMIRREGKSDAAIIFYGPSPSYNPDEFLADENMFVVRGEPEMTFSELAYRLARGDDTANIQGLTSLVNGKVVNGPERSLIENLDLLPFPARHLLSRDVYNNPKLGVKPFTSIYASRNCRFKCVYCVPCSLSFARELEHRRHHGGKKPPVGVRSANNIIEEFRLLERQGYRSAMFLDDQFIWDEERTIEMCAGIADTGIIWGCASRADFISNKVVASMKKAGCQFIDIGVESFDQRILNDVRKGLKLERIQEAIRIIKRNGIDAKINILVGCSALESKETIRNNRRMVKKLGVDQVMYNIANPFPGTDLYEIAKRDGWFVEGDYRPADVQKESIIRLPELTPEELVSEVRKANFAFFLSPKFVIKRLLRFRSLSDLKDAFIALKKKLF